jgi:hypothetical protein
MMEAQKALAEAEANIKEHEGGGGDTEGYSYSGISHRVFGHPYVLSSSASGRHSHHRGPCMAAKCSMKCQIGKKSIFFSAERHWKS